LNSNSVVEAAAGMPTMPRPPLELAVAMKPLTTVLRLAWYWAGDSATPPLGPMS